MEETDSSAVTQVMEEVARRAAAREGWWSDLDENGIVSEVVAQWALRDAKLSEDRFRDFLELSGLPNYEFSRELKDWWRTLWMAGLFIPLAKYVTAVPLASWSGVNSPTGVQFRELPPPPDWLPAGLDPLRALLLPSADKRILAPLRTRLREKCADGSPTKRCLRLCWSLQGVKNMMPAMWVTEVAASLKDHSELLSSSPPPLSESLREILDVVGTSVAQACYPAGSTLSKLPQPKLSASSGWVKIYDEDAHRFRSMEGTRAAQHERLGGRLGFELTGMSFTPRTGVQEYRSHPYQFNWADWDFVPRVDVVALQEPFKIRVITIADGPATAAASPLQKVWHRYLRNLRPFALIGGGKVAHCAGEMFQFDDGRAFVSGDYSAATDRLSLAASRVVFEALLRPLALPAELRRRIETGLFAATLNYSNTLNTFKSSTPRELLKNIPVPPETQQKNGQLMGNVLSFPILCLVNFAGYIQMCLRSPTHPDHVLAKKGIERGHWTKRELNAFKVLINGDDILFKSTPEEYAAWREEIGGLGLKLSVGKNFFSEDFFTVNSELYTRSGFTVRPWWGGLLTDTVRMRNELKWELGVDCLSSDLRRVVPAIQTAYLASFPVEKQAAANNIFISTYRELLQPYSGLNWFIPVELGGLGLNPVGQKYTVTYLQAKLANRLHLTGELPKGFAPEGTLLSQDNENQLKRTLPRQRMRGELVTSVTGQRLVLDKDQPLEVVLQPGHGLAVYYRAYPLVQDVLSASSLFSRWLDYHVDGVRVDIDKTKSNVTKMLRWGGGLSDKKCTDVEALDLTPSYDCVKKMQFIKV